MTLARFTLHRSIDRRFCAVFHLTLCLCLNSPLSRFGLAEITTEGIQKSFEELVIGKYIDKVAKLDLVTPTVEPEKAK